MAKKAEIDPYRTTDKHNRHTADGEEVLNPTPVQPPLGYNPQPSIRDQIRQQVMALKAAENMEPETEEEADDFDIEDDPPIPSRWENDMVPSLKETRARIRALEEEEKLYARPPTVPAAPAVPEPPTESKSQ